MNRRRKRWEVEGEDDNYWRKIIGRIAWSLYTGLFIEFFMVW
jgi:hypothetical protein